MKAKKIVTLLVAAALTCGVVGSTTSVYAADVTLKLAHADAEGTIFDQGAVAFQEKLQELSGGTMDVELYRNGTLGSLSEVAEGIQMGTVDVAPIVTTTLANFASELNAFDMPYIPVIPECTSYHSWYADGLRSYHPYRCASCLSNRNVLWN